MAIKNLNAEEIINNYIERRIGFIKMRDCPVCTVKIGYLISNAGKIFRKSDCACVHYKFMPLEEVSVEQFQDCLDSSTYPKETLLERFNNDTR